MVEKIARRPGDLQTASDAIWSAQDQADLAAAIEALEHTSFATQLTGLVGRQIGLASQFIPDTILKTANATAAKALSYAMRAALTTLAEGRRAASQRLHLAAIATSGALGGAFGLATLPFELPVSTTLILRSIGEIARQEGEDLGQPETSLACLEVFALSGGREAAHFGEGSYFATRALLARSVTEAARYFINRGVIEESAPALLRLVSQIASRFGVVVTQKIVAQSVPVIGAVTGAAINAAFMDHYQRLARGHFVVRRLERTYGADAVRRAYEALRASRRDPEDAVGSQRRLDAGSAMSAPALKQESGER
ncbi:MAG TPA: EcsC family protein [Lichenihabitans sp.]|jgi:hypothetical protein|nr:EcsC family protein [Lichenihabitans sp.]